AIAERVGGDEAWYADESPVRSVAFEQGFWMSKTPVTVGDWVRIGRSADLRAPRGAAGSDRPVTGATGEEIQAFLEAAGDEAGGTVRLPTEAEWEYACRAGSEGLFPFPGGVEELNAHAWYRRNTPDGRMQPVGQKQANAWGLHD